MRLQPPGCLPVLVLVAQLWTVSACAQDLMLTKDSEAGFSRLMHMAETGQLGDDVTNANVGIFKTWVQVELVRAGAAKKLLFLTPKSSAQRTSRYFNVEPGEGATVRDVARVGKALDEVFEVDPFQFNPDFDASPGGDLLSSLVDAWGYGGWRGVLRASERRMAALTTLRYTIAVTIALTAALLACLRLLWGSAPPRSTVQSLRDSE